MITRQEIMNNISMAIKNSGKTQAELAKVIGVKQTVNVEIRRGEAVYVCASFF